MFDFKNRSLEQAAEFHFFIRRQIHNSLKQTVFPDILRKQLGKPFKNHFEMWKNSSGDRFLDMTTMVRIGTAIEEELRTTYMRLKGHENLVDLRGDPDFCPGVFQRIMPWQKDRRSAKAILRLVGVELEKITNVQEAREVMAHRHLYAHNMGLVDERYIGDWLKLTKEDIEAELAKHGYPAEDCYWFKPLDGITKYIECVQNFVKDLKKH